MDADFPIDGFTAPPFEAMRDIFARNFAQDWELGASFCATVEGEVVVDLWGGWADAARTRPWQADTLVNVYSVTKTMTALCALILSDRGMIDLDAPVAYYWPEFAAAGKADIRIRHVLSHSAGLCGWAEPVRTADLYDWDRMVALLAAQAPFWEPGTACGYHAWTQGFLIGEVVRRVTGQSIGTFFRREVAGPLGADFHIGLAEADDHRIAELVAPPAGSGIGDAPLDPIPHSALGNPRPDPCDTRSAAWRRAELPASGGHGSARSIARVQTVMANDGHAWGHRLLSPAGVRRALEPQIEGHDLVLNRPARFGMGYGLRGGVLPLPNDETIFWGGYGGSLVVVDMAKRATFAYAMNRMASTTTGDRRAYDLITGMWRLLDQPR